jgi:deazaflavin-dependent oxidoreductase (nitroreductase family)
VAGVDLVGLRRRWYQAFAKMHGRLLVRTNGRPEHLTPRLRCLVLHTTGRHSGRPRRVALLYMPDGDSFVVLAYNFGQDRPPAWWQNLGARPECTVGVRGRSVPVVARELLGGEREATLSRAVAYNKQWRGDAATMRRTLPVIRLEPTPAPNS